MAKLNIAAALTTLAIEAPRNYDLYRSSRKYAGFNISRYPRTVLAKLTIPCEYIARYEAAGGLYDSCGVWGHSPNELQSAFDRNLSPESLALICKLWGRTDFVSQVEFCQLHADYGFTTEKQYHALVYGKQRVFQMREVGIEWTKCYWSALKIKNFPQFIAKNMSKFPVQIENYSRPIVNGIYEYSNLREENGFLIDSIAEVDNDDEYTAAYEVSYEIAKCSPTFIKYFRDTMKHIARKRRNNLYRNGGYRQSYRNNNNLLTVKAFLFSVMKNKSVNGAYYSNMISFTTTEGRAYKIGETIIIVKGGWNDPKTSYLVNPRKIGAINVAKVGKTVFAWVEDFANHIEAPTVKESVARLQKIQKRKGGTLCLNDVRNDQAGTAGYCLAGTKDFARNRMPFLYRLIKNYSSWSEIPSDIMELEFTPLSYVWEGYRNPIAA